MKVLLGYIAATLIGFTASQNLLSLLHGPSRRVQFRRNSLFDLTGLLQRHNLVPSTRASAHASASSVGLAGGLAGIRINDLLGGSGLLAGHVGVQHPTLPNIAVRRSSAMVRPSSAFVLGQGLQTIPGRGTVAVPSQIATSGLSSGGIGTMMFDTPDPNTPDAPDLVYAPRSMMGDMNQVEAIRNRAEADFVVFV